MFSGCSLDALALLGAMAWRAVEDDEKVLIGLSL
jgi:hypothetical protein